MKPSEVFAELLFSSHFISLFSVTFFSGSSIRFNRSKQRVVVYGRAGSVVMNYINKFYMERKKPFPNIFERLKARTFALACA